jgi:outer membrane protein OmpA-like peptidoglycan-associated protein
MLNSNFFAEVPMFRYLLNLTLVALVLAGMSRAQTTASTQPAPTGDPTVTTSVNSNDNASAVPVDPQVAVPDEKNGQDPYGRPVEIAAVTPAPAPVAPTEQQQFAQNVKDVYFEYDRADLLPQDQATLQQDADWLKSHPNVLFTIAGEADPRGDIVYNVYLSDQRALATRDALIKLGVPEQQILFAEGWGKLYPVCEQDDESCWTQDRRAHLSPWSPDAGPTPESSTASGLQ